MNKRQNTDPFSLPGSTSNKSNQSVELSRQKGVGLIEVMIGVLIFMGGIIGVSGMQSQAMRVTHDSIQRSQAVWLANAAVELMKLNPQGLDSSVYQTSATRASANITGYCARAPKQCIGNICTTAEMATFDVHDLMCRNANSIIEPTIAINCSAPCSPGSEVTGTIGWGSRGAVGGVLADRQQLDFAFRRN